MRKDEPIKPAHEDAATVSLGVASEKLVHDIAFLLAGTWLDEREKVPRERSNGADNAAEGSAR